MSVCDWSRVVLCLGSEGLRSKCLGLQFVLIYFVVLLRPSQAVQFQTAFLSIHTIVHVIVDIQYLQLFERFVTNTWGLVSLQNTENEANLLLPLGIQKLNGFQL